MTKLLIDGDILCYRAGFATDKTKYLVHFREEDNRMAGAVFSDKNYYLEFESMSDAKDRIKLFEDQQSNRKPVATWSRKESEPEDKALMLIDVMLGDIKARYENATIVVYLTGVGNYRHGIATRANYKGNRAGSVPPVHLKAIRNHLLSKWNAVLSFGEEADDLIAIEASRSSDAVIVTIDKDLMQVPGTHYDFVKKEEKTVSQKEAIINFYSQVISGDSTDNIKGATGYGPVKARKALDGARSPFDCWQICLAIYTKEFGDISGPLFALEAGRLVYVRRKEGEIWNAPTNTAKAQQAA